MIHGGVSHSHDCLVTLHSNQPIATRCLVCIPETVLLGTFLVEDGTISAKFVSLVGGTDPIASRMLTRVVMRPQNPVLFLFFFFFKRWKTYFWWCVGIWDMQQQSPFCALWTCKLCKNMFVLQFPGSKPGTFPLASFARSISSSLHSIEGLRTCWYTLPFLYKLGAFRESQCSIPNTFAGREKNVTVDVLTCFWLKSLYDISLSCSKQCMSRGEGFCNADFSGIRTV